MINKTNIDKGARWYFHDVGGALIRKRLASTYTATPDWTTIASLAFT